MQVVEPDEDDECAVKGRLIILRDGLEGARVDLLRCEWCGPLVPAEEVRKAWDECEDRHSRFGFARWDGSRAKRVAEGNDL